MGCRKRTLSSRPIRDRHTGRTIRLTGSCRAATASACGVLDLSRREDMSTGRRRTRTIRMHQARIRTGLSPWLGRPGLGRTGTSRFLLSESTHRHLGRGRPTVGNGVDARAASARADQTSNPAPKPFVRYQAAAVAALCLCRRQSAAGHCEAGPKPIRSRPLRGRSQAGSSVCHKC